MADDLTGLMFLSRRWHRKARVSEAGARIGRHPRIGSSASGRQENSKNRENDLVHIHDVPLSGSG